MEYFYLLNIPCIIRLDDRLQISDEPRVRPRPQITINLLIYMKF